MNHCLQKDRPLNRELNQTHLQQLSQIPNLSQTHFSHLIEALNQLAKRSAKFHGGHWVAAESLYAMRSKGLAIDDKTKSQLPLLECTEDGPTE